MAKNQYLDMTGLTELVTQIKNADTAVKNFAGDLTGKTDAHGQAYTSVQAYLEDQIAVSSFDGNASSVSVADADGHFTATNVETVLAEIATAIELLNNSDESVAGSVAKMIRDEIGTLSIGGISYDTVKGYVDALNAAVLKLIHGETGSLNDLTTTAKGNLVAAINEVDAAVKAVDVTGKADKAVPAAAGNFASLDADGNLTDSGKKAADFEVAGAAAAVLGTAADVAGTATVYGVKADLAALGTASTKDFATADIADDSTDANLVSAAQVAKYVKDKTADVTGVLHFKGVVASTSEITDPKAGDVVVISGSTKEYIYDGSNWVELGDESAFVLKTTQIAGLTLSSDITAASLKTALDVDDLETLVGNKSVSGGAAATGLCKDIEDLQALVGEGIEGIPAADITALFA